MEKRTLGSTDLKVSPLCLGSMQFGWTASEQVSKRVLTTALDAGINFIDTADIYSRWADDNPGGVAENIIGRWVKESGIQRDRIVIATKVRGNMGGGPQDEGLSAQHIISAVENSLRRLQTDYIDLYQAHWSDPAIPIDETLRAFDQLIQQGKLRYIGASNYAAWELMQALWVADKNGFRRYDSLQPHYNLVNRAGFERELAMVCQTYRLGVIPYSPLAGGFLTGKYHRNLVAQSARAGGVKRYFNERNWNLLDQLENIAREKNASISQVALAWVMANPLVTCPIIGANSLEQLKDNLGAAQVQLSIPEKNSLDQATSWKEEDGD